MEPKRVIFLSAVSNEFHRVSLEQRYLFQSYRDVLKQAFDTLARGQYEVIVQEDLVQGFKTLLETLDDEIARSLFVVHLVGDLAGSLPEPAELRILHKQHPDLFSETPELRTLIGDGAGISYTQWEFYLASHYDKNCLVFEARADVPRSPLFVPVPGDKISQDVHRRRVAVTGRHRGDFYDQGDVARRVIRSFLHDQSDPLIDPVEPAEEKLAEAWADQKKIVDQLAAAIKKPDPRKVPVTDLANVAAFVAAIRAAAERWEVNLSTIVNIAARYEEQMRAATGDQPTFQSLYDEAFAQLALGDYTAAGFSARRAADMALKLLQQEPEFENFHREDATNALLLLHDAAKAAHNIPAAIAALEEAGALIDKEAYPLLWADTHEPLARFLIDFAVWDRAEEMISELVDIREDHQGENHPALAKTLLLWALLLSEQANYKAMKDVAARAEIIFGSLIPVDLFGQAAAIGSQGLALKMNGQLKEAELLQKKSLALHEECYGPFHPKVADALNNLAQLLKDINRIDEAELLMRRALAIIEKTFRANHPKLILFLHNLAGLLLDIGQVEEAEPLMRQALSIAEESYGATHPKVASQLDILAQLLEVTNRHQEGELLMKRALVIDQESYGAEHPVVAIRLNNLASLFQRTEQHDKAESFLRQALVIDEKNYGQNHPNVATHLNNLAVLLLNTERLEEAEELLKQAFSIDEKIYGINHPKIERDSSNLALLLYEMGRLDEAEPLMRLSLEVLLELAVTSNHEQLRLPAAIGNYASLLQRMGLNEYEIQNQLNVVGEPFGFHFSGQKD